MSETIRNREPLSAEHVQENLDAYLSSVIDTIAKRGSENIKINLLFIAVSGVHVNCYFKDSRKIESFGRYSESPDLITHDKSRPFAINILSADVGNSANTMHLRAFGNSINDERISEIELSNPKILNNMVFKVEQD